MLIGMSYRKRHSQPQLQPFNFETSRSLERRLSLKIPSEISHETNHRLSNEQLLIAIDELE